MLLHFDEAQRINVLQMFHQALQPGGTLVMERTQKLPEALADSLPASRPLRPGVSQLIVRMGGPGRRTTRRTCSSAGSAGLHGRRPLAPCTRGHDHLHCG